MSLFVNLKLSLQTITFIFYCIKKHIKKGTQNKTLYFTIINSCTNIIRLDFFINEFKVNLIKISKCFGTKYCIIILYDII